MTINPSPKRALIAVDVQNDFLPGGALGVDRGDEVVDALSRAAREVDLVIASRDWHPADHSSFADEGGIWPVHCVANTSGSELHPAVEEIAHVIVDKATEREVDAYSAFQGTGLAQKLREMGVGEVLVGGLATDYCVKATVLDALREGFDTTFLEDASRAVNVSAQDEDKAIEEMINAGAKRA